MRLAVHPVVAILVYTITQTCVELTSEFATVGPAALDSYGKWAWIILGTKVIATVGLTLKAYIDPGFHNHQNGKHPPQP